MRKPAPGSREKAYKLIDNYRLRLLVKSGGSKLWKWSYSYDGKPKTLHFGVYPKVSLVDARVRRDGASALLSEGRDPTVVRKLLVKANLEAGRQTFESVARLARERQAQTGVRPRERCHPQP